MENAMQGAATAATPKPVDGWDASGDVVLHVHAYATQYLNAQLSTAQASDQRAITFAAIMIPTALALLVFALGDGEALVWGAASAAVMVLISAGLAGWSARPVDFYFPGTEPWCWWQSEHESFEASLSDEVSHLQEMIDDNDKAMRTNRGWLNTALYIALGAPVIGALAGWISTLSP